MLDPAPELSDDTPIEMVRFSPLIRKALQAAGFKIIGEVRGSPDDKLRIIRGVGVKALAHLRVSLDANTALIRRRGNDLRRLPRHR
jgi:hypothetical protein